MHKNLTEESEIREIKLQIEKNQDLRTFFNKIFLLKSNTIYLLKNGTAKRIEVAIDTLDDTLRGIDEFLSNSEGKSYLFLYGIFQLLICQQDALYYLNCSVAEKTPKKKVPVSYFTSDEIHIRDIRNQITGHPQETYLGKSGQVIRSSLQRFTLTTVTTVIGENKHDKTENISILNLISSQLRDTKEKLINAQHLIRQNINITQQSQHE